MKRLPFVTFVLVSLFAFAVHAQGLKLPAEKPAAEAKQEASSVPPPGPGQEPDPKIVEDIMACLAEGLPPDWKHAWFIVREAERDKTGKERIYIARFFVATDEADRKGKPLQTCGANQIVTAVGKLNEYLPANQQRWTGATFNFYRDGRFEVAYDFTPPKPAAKKPAAKPAAKKKPEAAK